jgi:hypothetical protein
VVVPAKDLVRLALIKRISALAAAQRCSGARAITAQRSPSTTCSGTGMAALELSQQSLTRGAGTGAARRAPSHCRQCSGPWQRWQQRSQYCAAELSLAQAASYASCDAAVTAALEPHWRSVRTSARASAAGGQHQWPAGSAPTVRQSQIERESGHKRRYAPQMPPIITILTCSRWKGLRYRVLWLLGGPNRHGIPCRVRGGCPPEGCLVG